MKSKLIFLVVFVLIAQITRAQSFGIKGGLNIANMTFSASGMNISPKSIVGLQVGPVAEFKLKGSLSFNTGLLYSLKGAKVTYNSVKETTTLNYLEIPLNFAYKFVASQTSNFFIQVGPYLGYALSGKDKMNGETTDIEFGDGGAKRFDCGVGFGLGLELGRLVPSINYQIGLANINDDTDFKLKNKVFQISIAYMFGKK